MRIITKRVFLVLLSLFALGSAVSSQAQIDWEAPFPAHQMIDNIYFVGTEALGTYLITTDEGHILVNTDFESTVPVLKENVESLGFNFDDIKIIVGSHAHGDHMQGDALVKAMTGADVIVMAEDVADIRMMRPGGKEHPVDRIIHDGDTVTLGDTTLVAYLTPGHSKGCTTWGLEVEEYGESYDALIVCSYGANANYVLVDNPVYPEIANDYISMYQKVRNLPVDVFLGSHGFFYDLNVKYEKLQNRMEGDLNPYIDKAGYMAHVETQEQNFLQMLQDQQAD